MKRERTYEERNKGNPMQLYRITRPGGTHTRNELVDGKLVPVRYSMIIGERNHIKLTKKGSEALAHLGLVPAGRGTAAVVEEEKIEIPEGWKEFTPSKKSSLAKKITGEKVEKEDADKIIEDYLNGTAQTDTSGTEDAGSDNDR